MKKHLSHEFFMQLAYNQAQLANKIGEVPIGAILVKDDEVISSFHNQTLTQSDPTAHAEMLVIRQASKILKNHRLVGTKLYVTMEPCMMCLGAIVQARIAEIIYACNDLRVGVFSKECYHLNKNINHNLKVTSGIMVSECSELLKKFFLERRNKK